MLALFLLYVFGNDLDRVYNLWLALVPILLLPTAILAIFFLVSLLANLINRRWRRLASLIASPVLAAVPLVLLGHLGITPSWLRFEMWRDYYEQEVAQIIRHESEPRFKSFDWGGTGGAAVINFDYALIFDESDEIALPPAQRSPLWWRQAAMEKLKQVYLLDKSNTPHVTRISGHFYLFTQRLD
jgi:hypothetical protein